MGAHFGGRGLKRNVAFVSRALAAALLAGVAIASGAGAASKPNPHAELDCNYCHLDTPRFGVDTVDTVNFWRGEGDEPQLCERCHGPEANFHPLGVTPGPEHLGTRAPEHLPLGKSEDVRGLVVCTTCHFLHAADADHALLRGFPGADDPTLFLNWQELCRECHGAGLERRSPHAGDERSCSFCHSTRPVAGQPAAVTPAGSRLCEFCHGPRDEAHSAGVNPFKSPQPCTGCHDPHLGKDHPARLKASYFDTMREAVTLNPHRKRVFCFACHTDAKPGVLRDPDLVALCQRCHGSGKILSMNHPMTKVPAGYTIPQGWPLAGGAMTCLTCHFAGHAPGTVAGRPDEPAGAPHQLRGGVAGEYNTVCFRCHKREQWAGRNPHQESGQKNTGCTLCHVKQPVQGEDRETVSRFVADINILCLSCHDRGDHPVGVRHTVMLTAKMPVIPDQLPLGTGGRITCATCHNPHGYPQADHGLREFMKPSAFCLRCHKL
jgi:predicted CXXCH cytochrome family protein